MEEKTQALLRPVLDRLDRALGQEYSLVIYGSAARGEFLAGRSDLNLLLVADQLDGPRLREVGAALGDLTRQGYPPPLLIERGEWGRAGDVFPIEIRDMQAAHQVLRGSDPLSGMQVDPADLRRALEQELRGKLLRLRQAYALHAGDPEVLQAAAAMSVSSVAALLRVTGFLLGMAMPRETAAMLSAIGAAIGVDCTVVATLWEERRRGAGRCDAGMFERYLAAITAAIRVVDQFTGGGR